MPDGWCETDFTLLFSESGRHAHPWHVSDNLLTYKAYGYPYEICI